MANLTWYQLQGVHYKLTRFQREGTRTGIYVKDGAKSSYMGINGTEFGSFTKIVKDCNLDYKQCDEPTYEKAPCEVFVTKLHRHINICGKCKTITGGKVDKQGVSRSPKTVITVAGLKTFNLNGMIPVLKEQEAHVEIILAEYKSMIETIERFPVVQEELKKAQRIIAEHQIAVKHFMKDIVPTDDFEVTMEHINTIVGVPVIPKEPNPLEKSE